jgi:hypothetical protein
MKEWHTNLPNLKSIHTKSQFNKERRSESNQERT